MRVYSLHLSKTSIVSVISLITALVFSSPASAREAYLSSALSQQIPGITSCASCHSSSKARWPGISAAFKSGGLMAISQCLANNTCGANASGGSTASALLSKTIVGSVGSSSDGDAATNVYKITCPKKTVKLAVSVNDQAPVSDSVVTIQAFKNFSSSITSDPIDGDDAFSPVANLERGSGLYTVLVSKQLSGTPDAEIFTAKLECVGKPKPVSRHDDGEGEGHGHGEDDGDDD
jgi:hypothetical protein